MLGITMLVDILVRFTPKVTTIICHHMKKILLYIYINMERLYQNSYINKINA